MGAGDLQVVAFTLQMAATATAAILVPGVAAAFFLARYRGPGRSALETLLSLPLVLLSRLAPLERRDRGIRDRNFLFGGARGTARRGPRRGRVEPPARAPASWRTNWHTAPCVVSAQSLVEA